MSSPGTAIQGFPLGAPSTTGEATFSPKRKIGDITADVTIFEQHNDQLTITQHPVEKGAAITDHAFKQPAQLGVLVGFSNSSSQSGYDENYINEMYQKFIDMQFNRDLIDVLTARRNYKNMLIAAVSLTTDQNTENSAIISIQLQEVILVSTQTVTVPPNETQKQPEKTATTTKTGVKQAKPISNPPADLNTNPGATTLYNIKPIAPIH